MYTYKCNKCERELTRDEFHKDSSCSKGHHSICKECRKGNRNPISELVSNARYRAKKSNREFNITKQYIRNLKSFQDNKCALSGKEMIWNKSDPHAASIDRINSNKGYTKENTQLVCKFVNRMKSFYQDSTLIEFCKKVVEHNT